MDREAAPLFLLDDKLTVTKVPKVTSDAYGGTNSDISMIGLVETFQAGGKVAINPEKKSIT